MSSFANSAAGGVRLRRAVMLQQMKDYTEGSADEDRTRKHLQDSLWNETYYKMGMGLVVLVVVLVGATLHLRNMQRRGGGGGARLPPRNIITLLPPSIDIEKNLPTLVMGYAIATPDNVRERTVVQRVVRHRSILTSSSVQTIWYHPVTHSSFVHQMITSQPGALDYFCGPGYQELFLSSSSSSGNSFFFTDALVSSCMFRVGSADGYVRLDLELEPAVWAGRNSASGVAVQFSKSRRIWSGLLLLPIQPERATMAGAVKEPATRVPEEMTKYLLASTGNGLSGSSAEETFTADWEEFLYKVIHDELADSWTLWTAVCTADERDEHNTSEWLVAHWCEDGSAKNPTQNEECCWIFDPDRPPRRHRTEDNTWYQ